ncbi:IS982 family transposase [Allochromatium humboldtianum]|uniref:IS982 family transposase n=1 Tax=Allochromatium humboldtianum TaxID=504901 RepID=A0A850RLD1_9GAMM|nr:IS982 family transposase [Allochromatium humboldtianum]NVZ09773.1 IS982 family transposase [Allochromatium humboldtianum]
MLLEDFIIVVYCCVDDQLKAWLGPRRLRQRGRAPQLSDSEAITLVVVGEFLGYDTDVRIWAYFRQHWAAWFPALGSRSRFARQAANLWVATQALQERLSCALGARDDSLHLVDGFPVPVCVITRARRCVRFSEVADYGHCAAKDTAYYGLHGHLLVGSSGVMTRLTLSAANVDERQALWELTERLAGRLVGDKGYLSAPLRADLAAVNVALQTPYRSNMRDPRDPAFVHHLQRLRRRIETVIGQLTERFHIQKVWARDLWHLTARIARKGLAHTLAIWINRSLGRPDLQFEGLISVG